MSAALLVIDAQNDFAPGGALGVAEGDAAVVEHVNALIAPGRFDVVLATRAGTRRATALDALREGLAVTVDTAGTRAVDVQAGDGERALAEIRAAGGAVT